MKVVVVGRVRGVLCMRIFKKKKKKKSNRLWSCVYFVLMYQLTLYRCRRRFYMSENAKNCKSKKSMQE